MSTTEKLVTTIISNVKKNILKEISKQNYEKSLAYISILNDILWQFYIKYYDQDIEDFIKTISDKMFSAPVEYETEKMNIVFIDSCSWDNHCLTQQYLRAFMALNLNILYVVIKSKHAIPQFNQIKEELKEYKKSNILIIYSNFKIEQQTRLLHEEICKFRPSKIFLHSFSILDAVAIRNISTPLKYRINLGDHHCWSGSSCTDYIIDFRNWGYTLSHTYRQCSKDKIIIQPYYPIVDGNSFEGFPKLAAGKILIFSGGASYKIIDKDLTFFTIILRLLNENPQAIILFACRGNDTILRNFIKKHKLENRLLLTGYRKDINEVLKHVDIYLNTYPLGGGLMVQYAAINGCPILNYKATQDIGTDTIEYCEYNSLHYSYTYRTAYDDIDLFSEAAKNIIENGDYRKEVGKFLKGTVISEQSFNESVKQIFENSKTNLSPCEFNADFERFRSNLSKQSFENASSILASVLHKLFPFSFIVRFPYSIVWKGIVVIILRKLNKYIRINK
ncbi:MAG: hypothetical protein LBE13_19145 [Bacteroidales bacterium]|jgi:hypothetical protein|nr:hypothetical protein [Bacteroidales bacterium]